MTITVRIVNHESRGGKTARIEKQTAVMEHGVPQKAIETTDLNPGESQMFTIHKGVELLIRDEY